MGHVVLLGDSIFDNAAYVRDAGGKEVLAHLRKSLPAGWKATLAAVDGATTHSVHAQLAHVPSDATHLVLSIGGNDALGRWDILHMQAASAVEVLERLAAEHDHFQRDYLRALDTVLARRLPTAICTIYYPNYPEALTQRVAVAALATFNDVILRAAITHRVPVIDLRLVCNQSGDYANAIEPSGEGGFKIAQAIVRLVTTHRFEFPHAAIYV